MLNKLPHLIPTVLGRHMHCQIQTRHKDGHIYTLYCRTRSLLHLAWLSDCSSSFTTLKTCCITASKPAAHKADAFAYKPKVTIMALAYITAAIVILLIHAAQIPKYNLFSCKPLANHRASNKRVRPSLLTSGQKTGNIARVPKKVYLAAMFIIF